LAKILNPIKSYNKSKKGSYDRININLRLGNMKQRVFASKKVKGFIFENYILL